MKRTGPPKAAWERKCPICGERFKPFQSTQKTCTNPKCAIEKGRADEKRRKDRELRQRKERLKTRNEHLKEAQKAFNWYIRERDHDKECISCGTFTPGGDSRGGVWDCGHYRSTGACPELRFEPLNAHKQCKNCNRDKSGNVVEYRLRLRERIGDENLAWLESEHEPKKWTVDDLKEIKHHYRALAREEQRKRSGQQ